MKKTPSTKFSPRALSLLASEAALVEIVMSSTPKPPYCSTKNVAAGVLWMYTSGLVGSGVLACMHQETSAPALHL